MLSIFTFYLIPIALAGPLSAADMEIAAQVEEQIPIEALTLLQVTAGVSPMPVRMLDVPLLSGVDKQRDMHANFVQLEYILRPIVGSLPKNVDGNLEPAGVRYALNRYFAHQHGWRIKSLEPEGMDCDESSRDGPIFGIAKSIEERARSLREVVELAAIIEELIHEEALQRLRLAYKVEGLEVSADISDQDAEKVMDMYMATYVIGGNIDGLDHSHAMTLVKQAFTDEYWTRSEQFVRDVRKKVAKEACLASECPDRTSWKFEEITKIAVEVGDGFGPFRHEEFTALKTALMSMESKYAQCVPLGKFYGSGMWQFGESADYLKFLGALEASNERIPHVIIPNYLNAHSNCLTVSSMYSQCFVNECDDIISYLEQQLLAEDATPKEIGELVAALPSSSVDAPRTLSHSLLNHLGDISSLHSGRVPLHSRLFSQWLHFAYPRECPYPHLAGTTTTLTVDLYKNVTGKNPLVTPEETNYYMATPGFLEKQFNVGRKDLGGTCMLWTTDEELVVEGDQGDRFDPFTAIATNAAYLLVFIAGIASASLLLHLVWTLKPTAAGPMSSKCCSVSMDDVDSREVKIF